MYSRNLGCWRQAIVTAEVAEGAEKNSTQMAEMSQKAAEAQNDRDLPVQRTSHLTPSAFSFVFLFRPVGRRTEKLKDNEESRKRMRNERAA